MRITLRNLLTLRRNSFRLITDQPEHTCQTLTFKFQNFLYLQKNVWKQLKLSAVYTLSLEKLVFTACKKVKLIMQTTVYALFRVVCEVKSAALRPNLLFSILLNDFYFIVLTEHYCFWPNVDAFLQLPHANVKDECQITLRFTLLLRLVCKDCNYRHYCMAN